MNPFLDSAPPQAVPRRFLPSLAAPRCWITVVAASFGCCVACISVGSAHAEAVVPQEPHVRTEYAQVLTVEPVYQTLRAFATEQRCDPPPRAGAGTPRPVKCRNVRVPKEFRRVIAYEVDYIHRGVKYRSRMPFDPGKRLLVKVSVMPILEPEPQR
ncbi:MAG: hypothetical protein KA144_05040 [Xanthomonadaceae bacterium]|nr:hypothetical protein [Xanthomonadaceae bacterium]